MTPTGAAAALVAACLWSAPVSAQPTLDGDAEGAPRGEATASRPPRIELAALGGVAGTSPDAGALVSVPLGDRVSFDAGASYLARVFRSPAFALGQAQLRIPFRRHLRSRYSLLLGVTHLEALDPREDDSPLWRHDVRRRLFPHAGASLQWPLGRHADLRVDAQLVVQGGELIPLVPRVAAGIAWPPGPRRTPGGAP